MSTSERKRFAGQLAMVLAAAYLVFAALTVAVLAQVG